MRILLVGGLGFVGTALARRLRAAGMEVTVLDKRPASFKEGTAVQADIRDLPEIAPHFLGKDLVINLAAEHQDDVRPLSLYTDVNVTGSRNVCAAAEAAGVNRIVFTSSVAIYGSSSTPLRENSPPNYFNEYGRTKFLAEAAYEEWREADPKRRLVIIRPTVIFGPGNRGNVYNLLRQIKHGPFLMVGAGRNVKSIAHVDNVAAFMHHVINRDPEYLLANYSDDPDMTMRELVTFSFECLGRKSPAIGMPLWAGLAVGGVADALALVFNRRLPFSAVRVRKFCASSVVDARTARATGFVPAVDLRSGLKDMLLNHV